MKETCVGPMEQKKTHLVVLEATIGDAPLISCQTIHIESFPTSLRSSKTDNGARMNNASRPCRSAAMWHANGLMFVMLQERGNER